MKKLIIEGNNYIINNKRPFIPTVSFPEEIIKKVFNFAYDMSFGGKGSHRIYRSGGSHKRKNGEIFVDTFQGKLAEFGFKLFYDSKYGDKYGNLSEPDLDCWDLGIWDVSDFTLNNKKIAVKSSKHIANLLLLECKDWDNNGGYIPNDSCVYFMIVFVRIKSNVKEIMQSNKLYEEVYCDKETLEKLITPNITITCDVPGYIKQNDLINVIKSNQKILKGHKINSKTPIDADNYYVQTGDLREWP